jgi:hypothetical protein
VDLSAWVMTDVLCCVFCRMENFEAGFFRSSGEAVFSTSWIIALDTVGAD